MVVRTSKLNHNIIAVDSLFFDNRNNAFRLFTDFCKQVHILEYHLLFIARHQFQGLFHIGFCLCKILFTRIRYYCQITANTVVLLNCIRLLHIFIAVCIRPSTIEQRPQEEVSGKVCFRLRANLFQRFPFYDTGRKSKAFVCVFVGNSSCKHVRKISRHCRKRCIFRNAFYKLTNFFC